PIRFRPWRLQFHEFAGQNLPDLSYRPVAAEPAQIFMDADQGKSPCPGRSKLENHRQCLREELPGHDLEVPMRGTSHAQPKRPYSPAVTILRALFIKPAAIKTHKIMETHGLRIQRVIQEGRVCRGQRACALRLLLQLI